MMHVNQHDSRRDLNAPHCALGTPRAPAAYASQTVAPWLAFEQQLAVHDREMRYDRMKRAADLVIACALLILALPLMAIVALAIKYDTRGPVFYRQERVGLGGRRFTLLKFRSMVDGAEADGRPVWAAEKDIRVTRVGRFIRCTRIDELPQLFNVLRGDMSVVGPRPERPYFVNQLVPLIPSFSDRHKVKPGITGWAQINYPYGASVEGARKKLTYDLYYIENRGLVLDLKILISTVRVVIFQFGAR